MPTAEVSEKMGYRIDGLIEAVSEAVAETDERFLKSSSQAKHSHRKSLPTEYIAA